MASGKISHVKSYSEIFNGILKNPIYLNGSTYDLDNYKTSDSAGLYYIGLNVKNSPANYSFIFVIVQGATVLQFLLNASNIYLRLYGGNPRVWSAWKKVETTNA